VPHHVILLFECTYKYKEAEKRKERTKIGKKNGMQKIKIEMTEDSR
jgi:hypothetical protein